MHGTEGAQAGSTPKVDSRCPRAKHSRVQGNAGLLIYVLITKEDAHENDSTISTHALCNLQPNCEVLLCERRQFFLVIFSDTVSSSAFNLRLTVVTLDSPFSFRVISIARASASGTAVDNCSQLNPPRRLHAAPIVPTITLKASKTASPRNRFSLCCRFTPRKESIRGCALRRTTRRLHRGYIGILLE